MKKNSRQRKYYPTLVDLSSELQYTEDGIRYATWGLLEDTPWKLNDKAAIVIAMAGRWTRHWMIDLGRSWVRTTSGCSLRSCCSRWSNMRGIAGVISETWWGRKFVGQYLKLWIWVRAMGVRGYYKLIPCRLESDFKPPPSLGTLWKAKLRADILERGSFGNSWDFWALGSFAIEVGTRTGMSQEPLQF